MDVLELRRASLESIDAAAAVVALVLSMPEDQHRPFINSRIIGSSMAQSKREVAQVGDAAVRFRASQQLTDDQRKRVIAIARGSKWRLGLAIMLAELGVELDLDFEREEEGAAKVVKRS